MTIERLERIQTILRETDVEAWLLYNFRDLNTIANRIVGFDEHTHQTRRWAVLIPQSGDPRTLVHAIESHLAEHLPGQAAFYSTYNQFEAGLQSMLDGTGTVAMEYSPRNALPVVAHVDAGSVELVKSFGVDVVSSGELIARLESRLTPEQVESAVRAGRTCRSIMMNAFEFITARVSEGAPVTEFDVVSFILERLAGKGLRTESDPNCSVGPNAALPHYQPAPDRCSPIERGDFVLIDLWGKEHAADAAYGDITWTAFVDEDVPDRHASIFDIVRSSRDAAIDAVRAAFRTGSEISGAELDDISRSVIDRAGFGDYFIHRTGHSITTELHGAGTNLDNFETRDARPILPSTSFSVEPGIYLQGELGIRSEVDLVVREDRSIEIPSGPPQREIVPLLRTGALDRVRSESSPESIGS